MAKIQFERYSIVQQDRIRAVEILTKKVFKVGEPCLINYMDKEDKTSLNTKIKTILAVGVKEGAGRDCYQIISAGEFTYVWGIVKGPIDVSQVAHGELYLQDLGVGDEVNWNYVYSDGTNKITTPLSVVPTTFINLQDGNIYYSDEERKVYALYDLSKMVSSKLQTLQTTINTLATKDYVQEEIAKAKYESEEIDISLLATKEYVNAGLAQKVDVVEGKGLSTNDFTNELKTQLEEMTPGDKNIIELIKVNNEPLPVGEDKSVNIDLSAISNLQDLYDEISEQVEELAQKIEELTVITGYCLHIEVDEDWSPLVESELQFTETSEEISEIVTKVIESDGTSNLRVNIKSDDESYNIYLNPEIIRVLDDTIEANGKTIIGEDNYKYVASLGGDESSFTWTPIAEGEGNASIYIIDINDSDYQGVVKLHGQDYVSYSLSTDRFDEIYGALVNKESEVKVCIGLNELFRRLYTLDEEYTPRTDTVLSFNAIRTIESSGYGRDIVATGRSGRELSQDETFDGLSLIYELEISEIEQLPLSTLDDSDRSILFYIRKNSTLNDPSSVKSFTLNAKTTTLIWEEIKAGIYPNYVAIEESDSELIRTIVNSMSYTVEENGVLVEKYDPARVNLCVNFPVNIEDEGVRAEFTRYVLRPTQFAETNGVGVGGFNCISFYGDLDVRYKSYLYNSAEDLGPFSHKKVKYRLVLELFSSFNAYLYLEDEDPCVKSITVNGGEKQVMDEDGNVNLIVSTGGTHDDRLTDDMVDYLNSKLNYTYAASVTITASPSSITVPTTTTEVTFTAQFKASKTSEASGTKTVAVASVSGVSSDWTPVEGTVDKFTKTVTIDQSAKSVSSGTIRGTVVNAEGKSKDTNGSKSVSILKPWFIFEGPERIFNDTTDLRALICSYVDKTATPKKTSTSAYTKVNDSYAINTFDNSFMVAIPDTFNNVKVTQLSKSFMSGTTSNVATPIGDYKVYISLQHLASTTGDIDIVIN